MKNTEFLCIIEEPYHTRDIELQMANYSSLAYGAKPWKHTPEISKAMLSFCGSWLNRIHCFEQVRACFEKTWYCSRFVNEELWLWHVSTTYRYCSTKVNCTYPLKVINSRLWVKEYIVTSNWVTSLMPDFLCESINSWLWVWDYEIFSRHDNESSFPDFKSEGILFI